jgi:hypothetical protein
MQLKPIPAAAALSLLMVGGAAGFYLWRSRGPAPGARAREPVLPRNCIPGVPLYKQWDPRWGGDEVAPSGAKMSEIGCMVCCVAMLYDYYGFETDPKRLNDYLSRNGGYTRRGLLRWSPCAEYTGGRARLVYRGDYHPERVEGELSNANPVIVQVKLPSGIFHWVLVVGKAEGDYWVHDSLGGEKAPVKLSRFGRMVCAMRILRKVAD